MTVSQNNMNVFNSIKLSLKMIKPVNFMLCVLYHNFKNKPKCYIIKSIKAEQKNPKMWSAKILDKRQTY